MYSLHTVTKISVSKFPAGKVAILQMYLPSSAERVPMRIRAESAIGSLVANRTCPVYAGLSAREKQNEM